MAGQLEPAGLGLERTGEGPPLVAEELRLQEVVGQGRTVDLDEGLVPARRLLVDVPGHDLFSHPGLPEEQDGRVGGRDLPGNLPQP